MPEMHKKIQGEMINEQIDHSLAIKIHFELVLERLRFTLASSTYDVTHSTDLLLLMLDEPHREGTYLLLFIYTTLQHTEQQISYKYSLFGVGAGTVPLPT